MAAFMSRRHAGDDHTDRVTPLSGTQLNTPGESSRLGQPQDAWTGDLMWPAHKRVARWKSATVECSICRRQLSSWHSYPDGRVVCEKDAGRPGCMFCGFPATHLLDEYRFCDECRSRAVVDSKKALELTRMVESSMRRNNLWLDRSVPVRLETLKTLKAAGNYDPHAWGRTHFISGPGKSTTSIEVRFGLPREIMLSTIAHEYGHVLLFAHGRFEVAPELTEGFCEFLAHETVREQMPTERFALRFREAMAAREDLYGTGFRRIVHLASIHGRARMTSALLSGNLSSLGI